MHRSATPTMIVMGVAGAGKSTVGRLLADRLGVEFIEGDDHHSDDSKAKMASGIPLDDGDRAPWLESIAAELRARCATRTPVVVACSALKRRYRDVLAAACQPMVFVHLAMPRHLIVERQRNRTHEYMTPSLLGSQFEALEPPTGDEPHMTIDISGSPDQLVRTIIAELDALVAPSPAPPE